VKNSEKEKKLSDLESANLINKSFDNISKLNNELVNMQREVAVKNYELEKLNKRLKELTIIDDLTGLFNRRFFYEKINEEIIRSSRLNYELILVSIDINNFKFINDNYGHEEGDILLISFADLLKKSFRKNFDSIFRFGGDEFVLLLVDCSIENSYEILKKINLKFSKIRKEVSISYGVVKIELEKETTIDQYLKIADDLMFEYKKEFKKNHF
jgi:diguanylate cyclase (GGDEF)-like protein